MAALKLVGGIIEDDWQREVRQLLDAADVVLNSGAQREAGDETILQQAQRLQREAEATARQHALRALEAAKKVRDAAARAFRATKDAAWKAVNVGAAAVAVNAVLPLVLLYFALTSKTGKRLLGHAEEAAIAALLLL